MDFESEREKQECLQILTGLRNDALLLKEDILNSVLCKNIKKESLDRLENGIDFFSYVIEQEIIDFLTHKTREEEKNEN